MNKLRILKTYFGHDTFRPGQESIIDHLLAGRDVMAIMPTGAGKSACYQIPALLTEGVTLVISPLISLMKDQVHTLTQAGISAAYINSSLTPSQYDRVCERMAQGAYKLVYVAPERLDVPSFVEICRRLTIPLLAVDEAHCVSQWGQDFRPGYLHIARFIRQLPMRPTVGAFTATATDHVREDIIRLLELRTPYSLTTGFDRPNLWFGIKRARPREKCEVLMEFLREREGQSGIVYCSTRAGVEEVCDELCRAGISATAYHAGMEDSDRRQNQEDFLYDRKNVMVATNAFGMGIDKSNVSFVVHYNMPKSMEAYYQEAGRAGRDGTAAECLMLFTPGDVQTARYMIENSEQNPDLSAEEASVVRARDLERLRRMEIYATTSECLRANILQYFGEALPTSYGGEDGGCGCGNCSNCTGGLASADITVEAQMVLSCIARTGQRLGIVLIGQILRGSRSERISEKGLDKQTTFGLMKKYSTPYIKQIIKSLIGQGYIRMTEGEYPILTLTETSGDILYKRIPVTMRYPADMEVESGPAKKERHNANDAASRVRRSTSAAGSADPALYKALADLRRELAAAQNIPSFYIFSNATLEDMCVKLPRTPEEFLEVSGVGQAKLDRYGEVFLSCIASHLNQREDKS
ncbi:MAG: DNA helicase RecQ [Ruminococcaceae bacterium]|nr:DNA helicase RecQ [Oscillospiraceae bacterium]